MIPYAHDTGWNTCGHAGADIIIIAGCTHFDTEEWLSCVECRGTYKDRMRQGETWHLSCGHRCLDMIYLYTDLPSNLNAEGKIYDYRGYAA